MSSAQNAHGGQETTAGGNPYGVTITANNEPIPEPVKDAIRHQARRLVQFAAKIAA